MAKLDALTYFIPSYVIGPDQFDTSELYAQYKACLSEPACELRFRGELHGFLQTKVFAFEMRTRI